ncbi:HXXEE domain-containing protein [Thermomonospora amylolytica]|uniref:HXXEE domain-containing protein n=1 Tax=Thermomonospora amylolytica TaxID=1411117 RepID=UPI000E6C2EE2|nr:HXXEE domain-containing protein [Thermomonospora amylolytica]
MAAVSRSVTWGLLAAWAVHDLEELLTMPAASRRAAAGLRARHPRIPERVLRAVEISPAHAAVAIGMMGGVMAAASFAGARSGGRSAFYQTALAGFGWHTVTHLAQSAVLRTYTPGAVTAPLVAAPFAIWAQRRLKAAGVPLRTNDSLGPALWLFPATAAACHLTGHLVTRRLRASRQTAGRS